jgi:hypothetical protein
LATTPLSISWPRSRSIERRRSTSTAAMPRARSRSCSTRTISSLRSVSPRAVSSASAASTPVSSAASSVRSACSASVSVTFSGGLRDHPRAQRRDLATGQEHLQRLQLGHQVAVAASGIGLTLERAQLATHLAQQVLHAQQAGLGGVEAALGLLLAAAVLQHAGGFFDDAAAVLGPGVEHRVDLALADDDVLLAADAGVAEQLLHVEQAAVDAVDRVLALAGAEQGAADGDLGELDGQQMPAELSRVSDHLGAAEGGALGGAGEDDVVHLLAAHRAGRLGAEHPRDGVDHVRLARPVGADHDGDPRLQLEGGGVGERLETFEGEDFRNTAHATLSSPTLSPAFPTVNGVDVQVVSVGSGGSSGWPRPATKTLTMSALPQVMQRCPPRSYTRW